MKSMDLPKGLQGGYLTRSTTRFVSKPYFLNKLVFHTLYLLWSGVGPSNSDKTLLSAIASALHTSPAPVTGQLTAAVEKNPGVWLNTAQPLCKAFVVTDDDIR